MIKFVDDVDYRSYITPDIWRGLTVDIWIASTPDAAIN